MYHTCTIHVPYMYHTCTIHVPYKYHTCTIHVPSSKMFAVCINTVYTRQYDNSFESLTLPADVLSTPEMTFVPGGSITSLGGVVGNAYRMSEDGSYSTLQKVLNYECLGRLDLCSSLGMTFNIWLRLNVSVWEDVTSYTLFSSVGVGTDRQGFRVTATGRLCSLSMALVVQQEVITLDFDCPVDKWFYLSIG